jgi:hypothetical protein
MVVDLKRFQPRKQLQEGLLWVVEQLPGLVEAADMTSTLSRGYCEWGMGWWHRGIVCVVGEWGWVVEQLMRHVQHT